jgi:hypothetical protein
MKGLAILACVLGTVLLADCTVAAQHRPRSGRHGHVLVGYIYSGGRWQFHVDLEQRVSSGPGYGIPRRPGRIVPTVLYGGVYGPVGFCRHGVVYLTEQPPNLPGGVFPLPRPFPPLPPITGPLITNVPPIIPVRRHPTSGGVITMDASRMSRAGAGTTRPPLPPTALQRELRP